MNSAATTSGRVVVTVELFGMARVRAGVNGIGLTVDPQASVADLLRDLAQQRPELLGNALCVTDDGTTALADGYALNRNGLAFLPLDTYEPVHWASGDSLLLLSNQAGG